jgi:hypothetical protein
VIETREKYGSGHKLLNYTINKEMLSLPIVQDIRIRWYIKMIRKEVDEGVIYLCIDNRKMFAKVMMKTGKLICDILEIWEVSRTVQNETGEQNWIL